jgi:hypothetical protein
VPSLKNEASSKAERVDRQVAKQFNVWEGYVHAAQKIKDKSPEILEMVKAGTVPIAEPPSIASAKVRSIMKKPSKDWF